MTPYEQVGLLVFGLLVLQSRSHLLGSALIGLAWPILGPLGLYFAVKRWVFGHGPSDRYFELELLGGVLVAGVLMLAYAVRYRGLPLV